MEPDGRTKIVYVPDTAAGIRALYARMMQELGETPTFDIPLRVPPPKNWRPWHKHTLPNRRRR